MPRIFMWLMTVGRFESYIALDWLEVTLTRAPLLQLTSLTLEPSNPVFCCASSCAEFSSGRDAGACLGRVGCVGASGTDAAEALLCSGRCGCASLLRTGG